MVERLETSAFKRKLTRDQKAANGPLLRNARNRASNDRDRHLWRRDRIKRALEILDQLGAQLRLKELLDRCRRQDPPALRVLTLVQESDEDLAVLGSISVESCSSVLDFDLRILLLDPVRVRGEDPGIRVPLVHTSELGQDVSGLGQEGHVGYTEGLEDVFLGSGIGVSLGSGGDKRKPSYLEVYVERLTRDRLDDLARNIDSGAILPL